MKTRVITAIVALLVFVPLLFIGGIPLEILVVLLGLVAVNEILVMRKKLLISFEAILSNLAVIVAVLPSYYWPAKTPLLLQQQTLLYIFILLMLAHTVVSKNHFTFDDAAVIILSVFYIGFGFHFFITARNMPGGLATLFFALLIVWVTDSGAYLVGRKIGKTKLAPRISPNKTWEGSIGGTVISIIVSAIYLKFFPQAYDWTVMLIIAALASVAGQFGDLIESALKRFYNVKDSGKILPGHGGILDRFDSLLIVLPVLYLLGVIY
ncbi:phosphatidate cytidylyltransferase [Periweissella ghanensis]|uniref:Phosphatidate cytidylyltransferase n=1 Tax=Periweissella ghanensis TaxID=467997 RepID=A0ABM8ZAC1_9LACO|nr:phosphatidate cytidylyltransferase [Periweissella ghanensis]MCM0600676.1 phosphatidate cytidylyltransferase [Periweissella ghanensis]CAH0418434.1 Phosphatidate cytidylyltransferase [Periweissella ghanensis]